MPGQVKRKVQSPVGGLGEGAAVDDHLAGVLLAGGALVGDS